MLPVWKSFKNVGVSINRSPLSRAGSMRMVRCSNSPKKLNFFENFASVHHPLSLYPFNSISNVLYRSFSLSSSPSENDEFDSYEKAFKASIESPNAFWGQAAKAIHWAEPFKGPVFTVNQDTGNYTWFPNEMVNTCYNALDVHVQAGRGSQTAIAYDSPVTGTKRNISYASLLEEVSLFAGALQAHGVQKGDRIVIYMPMIPEAVVAMLASARVGAVHSVVFGGFASAELAKRISDAKPKLIISASCGIEGKKIIHYKPLLDEAISLSKETPSKVVIFQRPQEVSKLIPNRDIEWHDFIKNAKPAAPVPVKSTDPLYILYTSGTTGLPKGVIRDNGGHLVALKWMISKFESAKPGDVFWAASDIGWVVGHTFIVYAPLFLGCTSVFYEGKPVGTPDASAFWRVIAENKVNLFYTAPSAIRAVKKEDPELKLKDKYDTSSLRVLFLAGERADSDSLQWASNKLKVPVLDNWWQTETGWPIVGNPAGFKNGKLKPVKPGSACVPVPGYNVQVLNDEGKPVAAGVHGNLAIKLPLPPGTLPNLWQNPTRFFKSYLQRFPGYYDTADAGYIDEDGYVWILNRTDDILNVAGHRLSGGVLEEALSSHPSVAEVAVIGVPDNMKGHIPLGIIVLKANQTKSISDIEKECVLAVREKVGAVAAFKKIVVANRLPKTRSGKILRNVMRAIAEDAPVVIPPTIEDPQVVEEIKIIFKENHLIHKPL